MKTLLFTSAAFIYIFTTSFTTHKHSTSLLVCNTPYIASDGISITSDGGLEINVTGSTGLSYNYQVSTLNGSGSYQVTTSSPTVVIPPQGWYNGEAISVYVYITAIGDCRDENGNPQNGSSSNSIIFW